MTVTAPRLSEANRDALEIISRPAAYGVNYKAGYVGFTYTKSNIISQGIVYFTRWSQMHQIKVSHALIVSGENECIEAHMEGGVKRTLLSTYFDDQKCQIFFRKPNGLTPDLASRIITAAEAQLGSAYDLELITAQLESNSLTGRMLRRLLGPAFEERICKLHDNPERWICSELVAHCLDAQPEFHDKGVLLNSDATIDPQELFEDDLIFEEWHQQTQVHD